MRGDVGGATREDVVNRFVLPGCCPAGLSVHPETNGDGYKGQSGQTWLKPRWGGTLWFLGLWHLPLPHVRGAVVCKLNSTCSASSIHRLNRGLTALFVSLCRFRNSRDCSMAVMATAGLYTPPIPISVKSRYLTSLLPPPSS